MCDAYMLYAFYIHSKTEMLEVGKGGEGKRKTPVET